MRPTPAILLAALLAALLASSACESAPNNPYGKAAEQGNRNAQFLLGGMYKSGKGVGRDDYEAAKWFTKAADQGNVIAQYELALMYSNGRGVSQNLVLAYMWFTVAARQGEADAVRDRKIIAAKMTAEQIAEATKLSTEYVPGGR